MQGVCGVDNTILCGMHSGHSTLLSNGKTSAILFPIFQELLSLFVDNLHLVGS